MQTTNCVTKPIWSDRCNARPLNAPKNDSIFALFRIEFCTLHALRRKLTLINGIHTICCSGFGLVNTFFCLLLHWTKTLYLFCLRQKFVVCFFFFFFETNNKNKTPFRSKPKNNSFGQCKWQFCNKIHPKLVSKSHKQTKQTLVKSETLLLDQFFSETKKNKKDFQKLRHKKNERKKGKRTKKNVSIKICYFFL